MTVEYAAYERPRRLAPSIHMPAADIARVGRRQEQRNWGGLKRYLEAREEPAPGGYLTAWPPRQMVT